MARSQSTSLARFVTHYVRTLLKPGSTFATFLCTHIHTHEHKYILMLILFQKISQPKLHSTWLDSFVPIPDCLSVSIISRSASRSVCIFSLLMPHGCRCRHRNTHKPSQASQAEPAKQTVDQTELSTELPRLSFSHFHYPLSVSLFPAAWFC